jgi:hypothetical protein
LRHRFDHSVKVRLLCETLRNSGIDAPPRNRIAAFIANNQYGQMIPLRLLQNFGSRLNRQPIFAPLPNI